MKYTLTLLYLWAPIAMSELDEVVVVGKRQQNVADVPASISVFNSADISSIMLSGGDVRALSTLAPNLYIEGSNGRVAQRFYIRGLGNTDFDLAASQPVAVYSDGVVHENAILKSFPLFDINNISVLRGPQGSMYGRNSTAGAVLINTKKPTHENELNARFGVGNLGSTNVEGVINGGLGDEISGRTSFLVQNRENWIDNGYLVNDEALGGYEDIAFRTQILWEPSRNNEVLFKIHARKLNGGATTFRANVLSTGSNDLNGNYDRDKVFLDEGNGNPQKYDALGGSITYAYESTHFSLKSITAYEEATGSTQGDVDGGYGAAYLPEMGPGVIPFNSQTIDAADTDQYSQELLLSFNSGLFESQVGASIFKSHLAVETDPFFLPPAVVNHENLSWSVFFNTDYHFSSKLTLGLGLNYTDDEKDFSANQYVEKIDDAKLSSNLYTNYAWSGELNLWAKYTTGFRGPTIQGRDVAFLGAPSVADSETIRSFEIGQRLSKGALQFNSTLYWYEINDYQLSALGGSGNSIRLVNADKGRSKGLEIEAAWSPISSLTIALNAAYADTEIDDSNLLVATCGSGRCTPKDPVVSLPSGDFIRVDGNPFPSAPKQTYSFTVDYSTDFMGHELFSSLKWHYQGETQIFLYDSEEFTIDGQFEADIEMGLRALDQKYELSFYAFNFTDEENIEGAIDFNNLTAFTNEPRTYGISVAVTY